MSPAFFQSSGAEAIALRAAALRFDKKNTSSLVNYLKKMKFQCVVISLKDSSLSGIVDF